MNYLNFAVRNIKRHKKRTIITVFIICLGFTALGVIGGMLNNIFSRIKEQAVISEKLGHITIAKEGFFENGKIAPEDYLWNQKELDGILGIIRSDENVIMATPRLSLFGIASNGKSSTIFITEGIVPEDDKLLTKTNIDGRTERDFMIDVDIEEKSEVAIGSELSENLKIGEGDYLTLLTSTKDGIANAVDVDIAKVYNTGNPGTNDKFLLSNFYMMQNLYDTDGAQRIVVTIKDSDDIDRIESILTDKLYVAGYAVESKQWSELSQSYTKVKSMFGVIFRVLTVIITVIVLLTLLNTMRMAVNERAKEIGTIRAIGVLKKNVIKIFCAEGILMGLLGCVLAIPILFGVQFLLKVLNITFIPPVASTEVPINLILKPFYIIPVFILFTVASFLSSFFASRKIARQKVVTSLSQSN